jgi:hypothetical protein
MVEKLPYDGQDRSLDLEGAVAPCKKMVIGKKAGKKPGSLP